MRTRIALLLVLAILAVIPAVGASAQETPAPPAEAVVDVVEDVVEDDLLQITVDRLHDEAREFFGGDYWSLSVIRLSDGHLAAANGDQWHVSLSAAKAIWVAVAMRDIGADAVEPFVQPIFELSDNEDASKVIALLIPEENDGWKYHEGADAINVAMWDWGLNDSYLYGWFGPQGQTYGWHLTSNWKLNWPERPIVRVWYTSNFTSTSDLADFWAMAGRGELLDEADTAQFLEWARMPRNEDSGMITPRLPAAVAENVAHKAGWNLAHTRRIDGGVVTTPGGEQYAIAISFRLNEYQTFYWNGGARDWGRYASCEVYNVMAGTTRTCTKSGDPYEIINHTATPFGALTWASAERDRLRVGGWSLDRDAGADPIDVRITVDGSTVDTILADQLKTSVHDLHGMGNYHGFQATLDVDLSPGSHQVCAIGINDSSLGSNRTVGCKTITVPADHPPIGNLATARVKKDRVIAGGWAKDLDTEGPIEVKITLDGGKVRLIDADRGDGGHGFWLTIAWPLSVGEHEICAIAQNFEGAGPNRFIGCETVTVPDDWPPEGTLAASTADFSGVWVKGRAWDSDTTEAIEVRVEVDGLAVGSLYANRGTLNRKYNGTIAVPLTPGEHEVCTIGVNHTGGEPTTVLGCVTVTVADTPIT